MSCSYLNTGRLSGRADGSGHLHGYGDGQGYASGIGEETGPERTPVGFGDGQAYGECDNDSSCLVGPTLDSPKPYTEKICARYGDLVFFLG